jgi:5'-3' exonuclease
MDPLKVNLLVDGNYLLYKNIFSLKRTNMIYGYLERSLESTVAKYKRMYPFDQCFFISDSKTSWRKKIYQEYKGNRKKDDTIDWGAVFEIYDQFKKTLNGFKVLESDGLEGDDWIAHVVNESNKKGESNIIITNDGDIKQLINYSIDPLWINIQSNEITKVGLDAVYVPKNWSHFLKKLESVSWNSDMFEINPNKQVYSFIREFLTTKVTYDIDSYQSLVVKMISGDNGDNISSVWKSNGRNIGPSSANKIYEKYISEFGVTPIDNSFYENISDIICEVKNIKYSNHDDIVKNLKRNQTLVELNVDNYPQAIRDRLKL